MNMLSSFLVAAGLSMDNFAVTVSAGCRRYSHFSAGYVLGVSGCFALAHIFMFSAGWFGGWELGRRMAYWDHWIAFFLLFFVGVKMIQETRHPAGSPELSGGFSMRHILMLAVATSLDALGVGAALSLAEASFWITLLFMTLCVFVTSCTGFWLGRLLGKNFGTIMEISGGLVLIVLSVKILLGGLGIW